jgi:hypothetical protein
MEQATQLSMQALESDELASIVAHVIANPHIDCLDWHVQPVSVGAGSQGASGLGLFRLLGSATASGQVYPWSMIVKVFSGSKSAGDPTGTNQIPSAWNYWKREILAYRSGMMAELTGNLVAPRCYGVTEHANDEWRIWLEDIQETATTDRGHGGNELHKVMACWPCTGWTSYEKRAMYILNLLVVMIVEQ